MEKHTMKTMFRASVVMTVFALTAIATNAQILTNGSFELGSGILYTNTADSTQVSTAAVGWIAFNGCTRISTNDAQAGAVIPGQPNITAHTGAYSLKCYGPFDSMYNGAGAYQVITNGIAPGQQWMLQGYGLNWSGDPMTNITASAYQTSLIQIAFANNSGTIIASTSTFLDTNTPLNVWVSCVVTATAPVGTAQLRIYAMHVGHSAANQGSIYWDDLSVVNLNAPIVTNFLHEAIVRGNQVCWSTTTNAAYQAQSSPDNSTWSNVGSLIAGDGNTNCTFDAVGHKFYQVLELK